MKNEKNKILDKIDYILDCEFMIKNSVSDYDKNELLNIIKNYNISVFFIIKRKIKNFITFIYNVIFSEKKNFTVSRNVLNVKNKYDLLVGKYTDDYFDDKKNFFAQKDNKILKINGSIKDYYGSCISKIIKLTDSKNIIEIGAGELTQYYVVKKNLDKYGFNLEKQACLDLSIKRLIEGKKRLNFSDNLKLIQADARAIPVLDNEYELAYTCHCLEQVPHIFENCINEIVRISSKYIILIEPSFEKSNQITKKHIFKKNYIRIDDHKLSKIRNIKSINRFKMPLIQYVNGAEIIILEKK